MIGSWLNQYRNDIFFKRLANVLGVDILAKASGFVLIPIYLRLMTQEEFGLYNYLLSIVSTFSIVLNFGLYVPQSKYFHDSNAEKERGSLLFTIMVSLFVLLVLILVPLYGLKIDFAITKFLFKNAISYSAYRWPILLALIVTVLSFMLTNFFYTSEQITRVKRYNISRIIAVNLLVIAALYMLKNDAVETRLKYTYLVELSLLFVFGYNLIKYLERRFDTARALMAIKMGIPIMLSAIFGIIINFSDKFFLEKYGSFADLSNYYLAFSFANIIPLIFASLQNVWVPLFMKEKNLQVNVQKTNMLLLRMVLVFSILAVLIWLGFRLMLEFGIIPGRYQEASRILPLLLLTQIFASLAPLFSNYLVYFEKTYVISLSGLFISGISLALSLLLIPKWGLYGAAIASLVSNLLYLLIYYLVVKFYISKINIAIEADTSAV